MKLCHNNSEYSLAPIFNHHFIEQESNDRITRYCTFIHADICNICWISVKGNWTSHSYWLISTDKLHRPLPKIIIVTCSYMSLLSSFYWYSHYQTKNTHSLNKFECKKLKRISLYAKVNIKQYPTCKKITIEKKCVQQEQRGHRRIQWQIRETKLFSIATSNSE